MSFKLYSSLLRHDWYIDPTYVQSQLPLLAALIKGDNVSLNDKPVDLTNVSVVSDFYASNIVTARSYSSYDASPKDSIAVITVRGPIMKEDNCGTAGSMSLAKMMLQAAEHPNIIGIILDGDSPGGMVTGTQTFVDAILEAKKMKPVIGFVNDGFSASGMYWPMSACTEIIASRETDLIGSIGVFTSIFDYSKQLEAAGIKVHQIYADQSTEKNQEFRAAAEGDFTLLKENILNPYAAAFIEGVKANRGDKIKVTEKRDPFKGALYMSAQAKKVGLIDSIGNFNFAVQRIVSLSAKTTTPKANSTPQNSMSLLGNKPKKFSAISALTGKPAANITAADITAANEQLKAYGIVGAEISIHGTAAKVAGLEQTNATQVADLTKIQGELDTANAEVEKLGKQDGSTRKEAKANNQEKNAGTTTDATLEYNNPTSSWNQMADKLS